MEGLTYAVACLSVLGSAFIIAAVYVYDRSPKVFTKLVVILSWFTLLVRRGTRSRWRRCGRFPLAGGRVADSLLPPLHLRVQASLTVFLQPRGKSLDEMVKSGRIDW